MNATTTSAYRDFAAELGVLFQIVDDILDVTGTDADLGKPQGSDERHGKRTYVTEFGLDGARDLALRSHGEARASLARAAPGGAPDLEQITDFIVARTLMSLLDSIDRPQDLHALSDDDLARVAQEIREHIIDTVGEIGGHFGANLGVCELSVALHSLMDSPRDKILWDVGHQAYPHKILTGRRDRLETIRKYGGLAPFCSIAESEHDIMGAGHASTSIGYAVGLKEGMKRLGRPGDGGKVVAVIGDGSMTGGVAFEAIHQAGGLGTPIVVVLNDNGMSIAPNVGAMSRYFNRVRLNPKLWHTRESVEERLMTCRASSAPSSSASGRSSRSRSRRSGRPACSGRSSTGPTSASSTATTSAPCAKRCAAPSPPAGRSSCTSRRSRARASRPAEDGGLEGMERWHAAKPHSISNGVAAPALPARIGAIAPPPQYTKVFGDALVAECRRDERVVGITAAMNTGTGLDILQKAMPERYFDIGIAEQQAILFAAGLSLEGVKPVAAIYSTFLQRAYDQIVHDVCLQRLNVVFALDRAGPRRRRRPDAPRHVRHRLPAAAAEPRADGPARRGDARAHAAHGAAARRADRPALPARRGRRRAAAGRPEPIEIGTGEILREGDGKVAIIGYGSGVGARPGRRRPAARARDRGDGRRRPLRQADRRRADGSRWPPTTSCS